MVKKKAICSEKTGKVCTPCILRHLSMIINRIFLKEYFLM